MVNYNFNLPGLPDWFESAPAKIMLSTIAECYGGSFQLSAPQIDGALMSLQTYTTAKRICKAAGVDENATAVLDAIAKGNAALEYAMARLVLRKLVAPLPNSEQMLVPLSVNEKGSPEWQQFWTDRAWEQFQTAWGASAGIESKFKAAHIANAVLFT